MPSEFEDERQHTRGCVFLSLVAKHSACSCLKCSHGCGSCVIALLLHPLKRRWFSPMRKVDFVNLPFLGRRALMRLSSLCCQGLLLRMARDGLLSSCEWM